MGSHYIPVGKLKIDQSILDIACPAAGYGTTPPDPAIFCPANGYTKDPDAWEAPVTTVDPTTEQILLLCDDTGLGLVSFYTYVNSGFTKLELLNDDMSVVSTTTFSNMTTFVFPTQNTGKVYLIRLSPNTVGSHLTSFYVNQYPNGYSTNVSIYQAKFYTPYLTSLANAFKNVYMFKECIFLNLDSITSLSNAFAYTGLEKVTWPNSMPALNNMTYTFQYTRKFKTLDLSNVAFGVGVDFTYCVSYSNIETVVFSDTCSFIKNLSYFGYQSYQFKTCTFPSVSNNLLTTCYDAFYQTAVEQIKMCPAPNNTSLGNLTYQCPFLKRLEFQGTMDLCTAAGGLARTCPLLEEIIMPTSMNGMISLTAWDYWVSECPSIKRIVLPLSISNFDGQTLGWWGFNYIMEEITTCNNWGSKNNMIMVSSHELGDFIQPTLKVKRFALGSFGSPTLPAKSTVVDIDWANSDYSYATAPQVQIAAQLSAAEINRIFSLLPAMAKTIDVKLNPGYATCDKTIATAKGWTVS